jgi:hypothetical protein
MQNPNDFLKFYKPRLPEGAKILPFRRAHAMAMRHNYFQQVNIDHVPNYFSYLEAQASVGVALSIIYKGVVQACFGAELVVAKEPIEKARRR